MLLGLSECSKDMLLECTVPRGYKRLHSRLWEISLVNILLNYLLSSGRVAACSVYVLSLLARAWLKLQQWPKLQKMVNVENALQWTRIAWDRLEAIQILILDLWPFPLMLDMVTQFWTSCHPVVYSYSIYPISFCELPHKQNPRVAAMCVRIAWPLNLKSMNNF